MENVTVAHIIVQLGASMVVIAMSLMRNTQIALWTSLEMLEMEIAMEGRMFLKHVASMVGIVHHLMNTQDVWWTILF